MNNKITGEKFLEAVRRNNLKLVEEYFYQKDNHGNTSLHYACCDNNWNIMMILLNHAKNKRILSIKNKKNQTFLDLMSIELREQYIKYIEKRKTLKKLNLI